jgi:hypothetical protein
VEKFAEVGSGVRQKEQQESEQSRERKEMLAIFGDPFNSTLAHGWPNGKSSNPGLSCTGTILMKLSITHLSHNPELSISSTATPTMSK